MGILSFFQRNRRPSGAAVEDEDTSGLVAAPALKDFCLLLAKDHNDPIAALLCGLCYEHGMQGIGFEKNAALSMEFMHKAAYCRIADAMLWLSYEYEALDQLVEAGAWANMAANNMNCYLEKSKAGHGIGVGMRLNYKVKAHDRRRQEAQWMYKELSRKCKYSGDPAMLLKRFLAGVVQGYRKSGKKATSEKLCDIGVAFDVAKFRDSAALCYERSLSFDGRNETATTMLSALREAE